MPHILPPAVDFAGNCANVPRNAHFCVYPRYSGGSPALVPEQTAVQVAKEEYEDYHRILEGTYGDDKLAFAQREGLAHIVYARWEKGKKIFRFDVVTGETIIEPKELSRKEIERANSLRNRKQYVGLNAEDKMELEQLNYRAKIRRQLLTGDNL